MNAIDMIYDAMLREGEIKAQQAREKIAADEELRNSKHRKLKMTLKALAQFGPMFIPGLGPLGGLFAGGAGQVIGSNRGYGSPTDILVQTRQNRF